MEGRQAAGLHVAAISGLVHLGFNVRQYIPRLLSTRKASLCLTAGALSWIGLLRGGRFLSFRTSIRPVLFGLKDLIRKL